MAKTNNVNENQNLIKISEVAEDYSNIIIKSYLLFSIKKLMVNSILEAVISEDTNGLKKIDYSLLKMIRDMVLVNNYSNLDFSQEDIIGVYDKLKERKIIDYIIGQISHDECLFFDEVVGDEIQQVKEVENSVSGVLAKQLGKVIEKLPDSKEINKMIPKLSKEINKLDPEKLKFVAQSIAWNNGIKKEG